MWGFEVLFILRIVGIWCGAGAEVGGGKKKEIALYYSDVYLS